MKFEGNDKKQRLCSFCLFKILSANLSFSGCNRTYHGVMGKTYDLELHRPKEDKIPFICHLTFTAGGGEYGDLIQVSKTSIKSESETCKTNFQ